MARIHDVLIYTDGGCSGNPGPMGAGAVLICKAKVKPISRPLGNGTNNIAELMAISLALSTIKDFARKDVNVTVRTDSQYAIGMLSKSWKIKANVTLILSIKELTKEFKNIKFEKVEAHNGDKYNEWADQLAQAGVKANTEMVS